MPNGTRSPGGQSSHSSHCSPSPVHGGSAAGYGREACRELSNCGDGAASKPLHFGRDAALGSDSCRDSDLELELAEVSAPLSMLSKLQIDQLFSEDGSRGSPSLTDVAPSNALPAHADGTAPPVSRSASERSCSFCGGGDSAEEDSRREYIKEHGLDKVFLQAVDRAMRHRVASPIEFVAHELMRSREVPPS